MIFQKTVDYLRQHTMLSPGEHVLAAVSGGVDSMVMLHLLLRLQKLYGGRLVVAHLNHGLRGDESDRDEEFVKESARKLGLECVSRRINLKSRDYHVSHNLQAEGRRERYAFFNSLLLDIKGDKIALAHNAEDQGETVLMRMIRGSGIRGLGGIPPVRGNIIRPLLDLSRVEIESYALQEGIAYREDSSNLNRKYLRNSIRFDLMPLLKGYNPNICRELNILSEINRDVDDYLIDQATDALKKIRCDEITGGHLFLDLSSFNALPAALKGKIIALAFKEMAGISTGLYSSHILQVEAMAQRRQSGLKLDLPNGLNVFIEYDRLGFSRLEKDEATPFEIPLVTPGETSVSQLGMTFIAKRVRNIDEAERDNKEIVYLDLEKIASPLVVRNFQYGDRIKIKGMEGRKKIKNLFIDEKVPARLRKKIPLIAAGEEILWVVGLRHGGSAIADCRSKDILRISKG